MLASITHGAIAHPGLFRLTFGEAEMLTSEIIVILFTQVALFGLTVTGQIDMLTSGIIVILFTDITHEIITWSSDLQHKFQVFQVRF